MTHRSRQRFADSSAACDGLYQHDFVQVLGGPTYRVARTQQPRAGEPLRSTALRAAIEDGVAVLLERVGADGWEPVGPHDSSSLWQAGRVLLRCRRQGVLGRSVAVELVQVVVRCQRRLRPTGAAPAQDGPVADSHASLPRTGKEHGDELEASVPPRDRERSAPGEHHRAPGAASA